MATISKADFDSFFQIKPGNFKSDMQLLDIRQKVEIELTKAIEKKNSGEWFASDNGPGGGNILFSVKDIKETINAAKTIIYSRNLENDILIGRRVNIADDEWFYEVIFPQNYSGEFNTQ